MNKPRTFLCKNAEDNCPHYRDSTLITIGDTEKFICPKGKVNCESDYLEPVAPPDGPMTKLLKRVAVIAIPVVFGLLVWVYFATRPHPPFSVDVSYTSPPAGRIHPGDLISWTFSIKGGRPSDDPLVSFDSRSPSLLSNTEIKLETTDVFSRKYKLTGRANGQTGRGEVTVSVALGSNPKVTTNLPFEIVLLGPPTLALKSSPPLVLDAAHDSFVLSFAVSDEKFDAANLTFSATVDPSDKASDNVEANGGSRTVTISRKQRQNGYVKLTVRLATPDGRETNRVYDVTVAPPPPPTLAINVTSATPTDEATVHPGDEIAWSFSVEGGPSSEKPLVSAETLSPSSLPQTEIQLAASDETNRRYKLTARPRETGHAEVRILASLDGGTQETTLAITVLAQQPSVAELVRAARKAWLMKQYPDSIRKCDEALTIDPQCVEALTIKGGVLYSSARYTEALTFCNKALEIDPHYADAWFTKGAAEESLKKYQEAVNSYQRFLQFSPGGEPRQRDVQNRIQSLSELIK